MKRIDELVTELWSRLARGEKVHVAMETVEHPRDRRDPWPGAGRIG